MLDSRVLVLNRSYVPIHVTSARRAFALIYREVALVVNDAYQTYDFEQWRRHYNTERSHSSLGYRPPAPEAIVPVDHRPTMN